MHGSDTMQYLSFSGLFHLGYCLPHSSLLFQMAGFSFCWRLNIFQCEYILYFLYLSVDGHLGCLCILAIVNTAEMNMWMQVSICDDESTFLLGMYLELELLDHIVVLFLISWQTSILFSIVAAPIFIPTNSVQGFSFLYILANIYSLLSFHKKTY